MNINNTFNQERISDDTIFQEMDHLHAGNENERREVNPSSILDDNMDDYYSDEQSLDNTQF